MNSNQIEQLLHVSLRAVHAGRKYHLAVGGAIDCYRLGEHDTPGNSRNISKYWDEWVQATEQTLQLQQEIEQ